jgi:nicotinate-nucleotide adenylyltransferase
MGTGRFVRDSILHDAMRSVAAFGPVHLPPHAAGQKIGLLGGSFDPPHEGHRAASLLALKRLGLDRVWWLVSPGNPLKDTQHLAPLPERLLAARRLAHHPRIAVTDLEAEAGTRFTYDTVAYLKRRASQCHFVWLMGADNFIHFHRWKRWREIADLVPLAIIDRPGSTLKAAHSQAAKALEGMRLEESDARLLPLCQPPAFVFLHGPRSPLSSTALRERGAQT